MSKNLRVLELCAGAGGQALGLEQAGFEMAAAIELDPHACATLRLNRPDWRVEECCLREFDASSLGRIDLVAAGVPCPPFSVAGKQLGRDDERDLFPDALRIVEQVVPAAILLENVKGFAAAKFEDYRAHLLAILDQLGYWADWRVLNASDFGVPQLRPRFVLVGIKKSYSRFFQWPGANGKIPPTVGEALEDLMGINGWPGASQWAAHANRIAPTLVGGSKKHGGPDLGPTRAKRQWAELGVNGMTLAEVPPSELDPVEHVPRLTVRMAARIQGFPDDWVFVGRKTHAYRQVGNAFPPPVAHGVGSAVRSALEQGRRAKAGRRSVASA